MNNEASALLEIFRAAGLGWLIDRNPEASGENLLREIRDVETEYHRRYNSRPNLVEACLSNPTQMAAFIQSFVVSMTCPMRVMIIRVILTGASIAEIRYEYREKQASKLFVRLSDPNQDYGDADQFESEELWDIEVFRHFVPMKMGDRPILTGYYALRPH